VSVHLLDIEWLLSTLFDASLLKLRAAGNGGSFFPTTAPGPATKEGDGVIGAVCSLSVLRCPSVVRPLCRAGNYVRSFAGRPLDTMACLRDGSVPARGWR